MNEQVQFNIGEIKIGNDRYNHWKAAWRKLNNILKEGHHNNIAESLKENEL